MNSRKDGLDWLGRMGRSTSERVVVSKYYTKAESWPRRPVWWFQFRTQLAVEDRFGVLNMLCQIEPRDSEYHHLRVPFGLFLACAHLLGQRNNGTLLSLYLSAEEPTLFQEIRGDGRIEFGVFRLD